MDIQISVQNPQKAVALLEFLKSFELIDTFKVIENSIVNTTISKNEITFFDQFYGKTNSGMTIEQIDNQLNSLRNEWERDI
jgi:hypothetical protein